MVDADYERFVTAVEAMAATFRVETSEPLLEGFWMGLSDLSWEAFSSAAAKAIATAEHFPRPGELRKLAGGQTPEMRSMIAWRAVRTAIGIHGTYATVQFLDPATTAAVRLTGGWQRLCALEGEAVDTWARKEFERAYEELCASGVPVEAAAPLPGIYASHDNPDPASVRVQVIPVNVPLVRLQGAPHLPRLDDTRDITDLVQALARGTEMGS